jgi:hypothetical protein
VVGELGPGLHLVHGKFREPSIDVKVGLRRLAGYLVEGVKVVDLVTSLRQSRHRPIGILVIVLDVDVSVRRVVFLVPESVVDIIARRLVLGVTPLHLVVVRLPVLFVVVELLPRDRLLAAGVDVVVLVDPPPELDVLDPPGQVPPPGIDQSLVPLLVVPGRLDLDVPL